MTWTRAPAIVALQVTLDVSRPGRRDQWPDGTIGDAAHSARVSDHNPDADDMVCAVDVHDSPVLDDGELYESIKAAGSQNPVKYAINAGRIWSLERGERRYTGLNAHADHCHVSVTQAGKRRTAPWVLPGITDRTHATDHEEHDDMALSKEAKTEVRAIVSDEVDRLSAKLDALVRGLATHQDMVTLLRGGPQHPANLTSIARAVGIDVDDQ